MKSLHKPLRFREVLVLAIVGSGGMQDFPTTPPNMCPETGWPLAGAWMGAGPENLPALGQ